MFWVVFKMNKSTMAIEIKLEPQENLPGKHKYFSEVSTLVAHFRNI